MGRSPVLDVLRLAAALSVIASGISFAARLNDTGQSDCYDGSGGTQSCAVGGPYGRYGRDAAAVAGALTKAGAGAAGFDFTKIANDGSTLPAGAALGSGASDWACTRDNVTGLVWEMKTDTWGELRYVWNGYTWYSTAANNGGTAGSLGVGFDSCSGTLAAYDNQCNTHYYTLAVNAAMLCGHNDWRLPTLKELESIRHFGGGSGGDPAVDTNYFPNTAADFYWTADSCATDYGEAPDAWSENFSGAGSTSSQASPKSAGMFIRLVRSGGGP